MKIGFIGSGSMGGAMIQGLANKGYDVRAYDTQKQKVEELMTVCSVKQIEDISEIQEVDVVFIAVKPHIVSSVAAQIGSYVKSKIIVSIAAGITMENLKSLFGNEKIVRAMPNTPVLVGEGITGLVYYNLTDMDVENVQNMFNSFGRYVELTEDDFNAFTSICGCSPAFVYMLIEAMGNAGVLQGLPKELVYDIVAQSVLGSAKMVLESDDHPAVLKDNVCTPGGATIEGVIALEQNNFRNSIVQAAMAAKYKMDEMNKKY